MAQRASKLLESPDKMAIFWFLWVTSINFTILKGVISGFTTLWEHQNISITPKGPLYPLADPPNVPPPQPQATTNLPIKKNENKQTNLPTYSCLFWTFHLKRIMQYETFCDFFFFFTQHIFSKFTQAVESERHPFYGWKNPTVWLYYILFIYLPIDGHLDYLHCLAIMNNATVNIEMQVFLKDNVFVSFVYVRYTEVGYLSYLGIELTKEVEDLHTEYYKALLKET